MMSLLELYRWTFNDGIEISAAYLDFDRDISFYNAWGNTTEFSVRLQCYNDRAAALSRFIGYLKRFRVATWRNDERMIASFPGVVRSVEYHCDSDATIVNIDIPEREIFCTDEDHSPIAWYKEPA